MLKKQTKTAGIVVSAAAALGVGLFLSSSSSNPNSAQAEPSAVSVPTVQIVAAQEERPHIDVVFALDTTSSMSGMIAGAKEKRCERCRKQSKRSLLPRNK